MANPIANDDPSGFTNVFTETFSASTLTGWSTIKINAAATTWRIVGGVLVEDSDAGWSILRPTTIPTSTSTATSYRLSADIDPSRIAGDSASSDVVGLVFGYVSNSNHYRVEWKDFGTSYAGTAPYRDLQIVRVQNGTTTILAKIDQVALPSTGFNMGVVVDSTGISLQIDGVERVKATGAQPALGVYGLYSWDNDDGVSFDNVKVDLGGGTGTYAATSGQALNLTAAQLLANDTDPDNDTLTITNVGSAVNGTVVQSGTTITFTPTAGYQGPASFVYTASDGKGGTDTATVFMTVSPPPNRAPDAVDDKASTQSGSPVTVTVLGNDTDLDLDKLSVSTVGTPANGTAVKNADNTITYTPKAGFSGTDAFTYSISDGRGGTDTATVTVTVDPLPNIFPDAKDDSASTASATPVKISVLGNDTDANNDPLTVTAVSTPTGGTAVKNADNTITYTPNIGFAGNDTFTYSISDGRGGTDTATVTVSVAANGVPDAKDDSASTVATAPVKISVLGNDTDPNGDTLTVSAVGTPGNGTAVKNADNTITYTAKAGFTGIDTFTYSVADGKGGADTANVTVNVSAVPNAQPVANDDPPGATNVFTETFSAATLTGWTTVKINAAATTWRIVNGAVVEDSDAGWSILRPTTIPSSTSTATSYRLSADIDPSLVAGDSTSSDVVGLVFGYVSNANYYRVEWNDFGTDYAGTAPYRDLQIVRVQNGTTTTLAKVDQVALQATGFNMGVAVDSTGISLQIDGVERVKATGVQPVLGVYGLYSWDNDDGVSFDNVKVDVGGGVGSYAATSGQPLEIAAAQLLANDTDPDNDALTISSVGSAVNGTVAIAGTTISFTPTSGYQGPASFVYTAADGKGGTDTATVNVTVSPPANIALQASNFTFSEAAGTISIPVVRTGTTNTAVSVQYTTVDQTALAGSDYTAVSGVLQFAAGQTTANILIPITNDTKVEADETFNVDIGGPSPGAIAGAPRTATILITDNDGIDPKPVVTDLVTSVSFTEAQAKGSAQIIDPAVTIVDADSPTLSGGVLSITGGLAEDLISIKNVGTGAGQIGFNGTAVTYAGQSIGTATTGSTLTVTLNANATPAAAEALLEAVTYQNKAAATPTQVRTLTVTVSDGAGHTSDPDLVQVNVTPNVETGTFSAQNVVTGLSLPTAIDFDQSGHMYIAQQDGIIRVANNGVLQSTPFADLRSEVNFVADRGLLGIAVHPDFANNPYIYVAYTYDPPETVGRTGLAGPDGDGNRVARVTRITAQVDAQGNVTAVPGSEFVLLGKNSTWAAISRPDLDSTSSANASVPPSSTPPGGANGTLYSSIPNDSSTHSIGGLVFAPDGSLYISTGDGASYTFADARATRVLDLNSLSGKILRIDPITGEGLPTNPYYSASGPNGGDDNIDKVVDYGLRNAFRFAINPVTGVPYIGDVGWGTYEELNYGVGKNFGWPYYEGIAGSNQKTGGYSTLPDAAAFYASNNATPPLWGQYHASPDNARAIIAGDFYTGGLYPASYQNALFIDDYGTQQLRVVRLNPDGTLQSVSLLPVSTGVTVEMSMGPDGYLYYVDITGKVGRLIFTPSGGAAAASTASATVNGPPPPGSGTGPVIHQGTDSGETIVGDSGSDAVIGFAGNDTVNGDLGDDLVFAYVNDGDDRYDGGGGIDTYDLSRTNAGAKIDLQRGISSSADTGRDKLASIENVVGSTGGDRITGNSSDNVLTGGLGDDTFVFHRRPGHDIIADFDNSPGNNDTIVFDKSVFKNFAAVHAAMSEVGQDVVITIDDANSIIIRNASLSSLTHDDFKFQS